MGLFGSKSTGEICAICNNEIGRDRFQIANKEWICFDCFKKCGFSITTPIRKMSVEDVKAAMGIQEANAAELDSFNATKKIGIFIEFDDNQKKWLIPDGLLGKKKHPKIYKYSDIIDYELLEDGESITKGGLGSAIVGGALFGGVGAVVGGVAGSKKSKSICNSLKIKITVDDISNPVVYVDFITSPVKKDSSTYKSTFKSAQECLSILQLICGNEKGQQVQNNNVAAPSSADEILKYKNLLDSGIITQEEFDAKKKQLLGL